MKRVVIHVDDVGMSHGANQAFGELSDAGFVTAGSVMVPCPWFLEVAEMAATDPALDIGVHLTLTAEKHHYKWRPLTAPPPEAGLTDGNGFFWGDVATVRANVSPAAAEIELRAQVEAALDAGIDVTHLDAHMGVTFAPELCDLYLQLGVDYEVPILLTSRLSDYSARNHLGDPDPRAYNDMVERARAAGFPIFDLVLETEWNRPSSDPAEPVYEEIFASIPDGLTLLAFHPNAPGELDSIEPDSAHIRIDEYRLFSEPGFRDRIADDATEPISFRILRDEMYSSR